MKRLLILLLMFISISTFGQTDRKDKRDCEQYHGHDDDDDDDDEEDDDDDDVCLPIILLEFKGKQIGNVIKLEWTTLTETANDYFTIYQSPHNLEYWYLINNIPGAGNSNQTISYTFTDNNPKSGVNYYMLSQTDYNGTRVQYGPIAVQFIQIPEYNVWQHYNILGQEIK